MIDSLGQKTDLFWFFQNALIDEVELEMSSARTLADFSILEKKPKSVMTEWLVTQ